MCVCVCVCLHNLITDFILLNFDAIATVFPKKGVFPYVSIYNLCVYRAKFVTGIIYWNGIQFIACPLWCVKCQGVEYIMLEDLVFP